MRDEFQFGSFITMCLLKLKTLDTSEDNKVIRLQIWDTAGRERFRTITSSYYRGADGIIMFYDITDRKTFEDTTKWKQEIEKYSPEDIALILVGTKLDTSDSHQVSYAEGKEIADYWGIPFFETSSVTGENVDEAVLKLVECIKERKKSDQKAGNTTKGKPQIVIHSRHRFWNNFSRLFRLLW